MTQALTTPTRAAVAQSAGGLTTAGLVTLLLGAGLASLDFFVVNVALPTIDHELNASPAMLELVVAGYGIAFGLLLVVGGRLGDAVGRHRLFTLGMAAFTLTSLACGLAPTAGALVAARIAQGAAAAMMVPQVLATIQASTTLEHRSRALGMYGATGGLMMTVGQLLGGVMVAADIAGSGWRAVFLINVPIGIVGLVLAHRYVPRTRADNPARVDVPGTTLFGIAMFALLLPLLEGRSLGWPLWNWLLLAVSPVAFVALVRVERRIERQGGTPLLPPSVLRMPSVRRGLVMGAPVFMGFGAFMFVAAVTLQDGLGLGPAGAGTALTPMAVGFFVSSLISSRLVTRWGRTVLTVGALGQGLGIVILILTVWASWPATTPWVLVPGMVVTGFGQGLMVTTLFRIVLSKVPASVAGVGSGSLVTMQQSALALGVATLGTLYVWLSEPGVIGIRDAFIAVMVAQVVVAVGATVYSRRLPEPR